MHKPDFHMMYRPTFNAGSNEFGLQKEALFLAETENRPQSRFWMDKRRWTTHFMFNLPLTGE